VLQGNSNFFTMTCFFGDENEGEAEEGNKIMNHGIVF
jgi:hypothetical protein